MLEIIILLLLFILALLISRKIHKHTVCHQQIITGGYEWVKKDLQKHPRSKTEKRIINIFESITGKKFPTMLLSVDGKLYEYDGLNKALKVAVEISGPQHYKHDPKLDTGKEYLARVIKDKKKKELAQLYGYSFIEIPVSLFNISDIYMRDYIKSRLYDAGCYEKPDNYIVRQKLKPSYTINTPKW